MNAEVQNRGHRSAQPIRARQSFLSRFRMMGAVGLKMMFHSKLKLIGTLLGVVFAVVLSNQQAGTFLGLIYKNVMFVRNTDCDLWVMSRSTEIIGPGKLSTGALSQALVTPGVADAAPILIGGANILLPNGGFQQVTLVGTKYPNYRGGPWNVVAGGRDALTRPDTLLFEDSERELLGGLNLGSVREVNGRRVVVGGFTWGLIPFGPSYAFADFEVARELLKTPQDEVTFVLVKLKPGANSAAVKEELSRNLPDAKVYDRKDFESSVLRFILTKTAIGITFGTSTVFGLIVGFVIVSLSMFSAVVDNIREFGTLKAIGVTNSDLSMLLFVQSVAYALLGSLVGLSLVAQMAKGIRSAKLALNTPPQLTLGTVAIMIVMCVFASSLALLRLRKVEPAMVFR